MSTANDLLKKVVKQRHRDRAVVLGHLDDNSWWHIHRDEELPEKGVSIRIKIR